MKLVLPFLCAAILILLLWVNQQEVPAPLESSQSSRSSDHSELSDQDDAPKDTLAAEVRHPSTVAFAHGTLVDDENGDPIPGALIRGYEMGPYGLPKRTVFTLESDREGGFEIDSLRDAKDRVYLHVSAAGYASRRVRGLRQRAVPPVDLGEIELARADLLQGVVRLEEGGNATGGQVRVWSGASRSEGVLNTNIEPSDIVTIEDDGTFAFYASGPFAAVQAWVPGYQPAFAPALDLRRDAPESVAIVVRAGSVVRGRVQDPSGMPIQSVRVARWFGGNLTPDLTGRVAGVFWDETDEHGHFELTGLPSTEDIGFAHPHYLSKSVACEDEMAVELTPARWLVCEARDPDGRVVDADRIDIRLRGDDRNSISLRRKFDGRFQSGPLEPVAGSGTLSLYRGFAEAAARWPEGAGEHDLGIIEFEWKPSRTGVVYVENNLGEAIEGAHVLLDGKGSRFHTKTNASGEAVVRSFVDDTIVTVKADGYACHEEPHTLVEDSPVLRVTLTRGATVVAQCLANGEPIRDLSASVGGVFSATDRDGIARFEHVPMGDAEVRFLGESRWFRAGPVEDLQEDETRRVTFDLSGEGASVVGTVVDDDGRPVDDAEIEMWSSGGGDQRWFKALSDTTGRFDLRAVPAGNYHLRVFRLGCRRIENQIVSIPEVESHELPLVLERGATYRGLVQFDDGSRPNFRRSVLIRYGSEYRKRVEAEFSRDGKFYFPFIPKYGPYRLTIYRERPRRSEVVCTVETYTELPRVITLEKGGEVDVGVVEGNPEPNNLRLHFDVVDSTFIDKDFTLMVDMRGQRVVLRDIPAGLYRVHATSTGSDDTEPVSLLVESSQTSRLDLALEPRSDVKWLLLEVVDHTGALVPDVSLQLPFPLNTLNSGVEPEESGAFRLAVPLELPRHSRDRLLVSADGYTTVEVASWSEEPDGTSRRVVLDRGASIEVLFEWEGPQPRHPSIWGPVFRFDPEQQKYVIHIEGPDVRSARTRVRIEGLIAGDYMFFPKEMNEPLGEIQFTLGAGEKKSITHVIPKPFEISGVVTVDGDVQTEGGVIINRVLGRGWRERLGGTVEPLSQSGRYSKKLWMRGEYTIQYSSRGDNVDSDLCKRLRRTINGDTEVNIDIRSLGVRGTLLTPDGEPMPNVRLQVGGRQVTTDASGAFETRGHATGTASWRLDPQHPEVFGAGEFQIVEGMESVVLQTVAAATVVIESDSPGAERLWIWFSGPAGRTGHYSNTMRTTATLPLSVTQLEVDGGKWLKAKIPVEIYRGRPPIRVEFEVIGELRVVLLDNAGKHVREIDVTVTPLEEGLTTETRRRAGSRTQFDLIPGRYRVRVASTGHGTFSEEVEVEPRKRVELKFQ